MINPKVLTECDKEEIQFLGQVQSHGLFLKVSPDGFIQVVSENSFKFVGRHAASLLQTKVEDLIKDFNKIKDQINKVQTISLLDYEKELIDFQGMIHQNGNNLIIDLVPKENVSAQLDTTDFLVKSHDDIRNSLDKIAKYSGLDRVLLYLFESNGDGVVVGESKGLAGTSLLNHWFPASDIPQQARKLYVKNKIRFISNIDKSPINLVTTEENLRVDLGDSWIRAVSPIHIEYLKNMGTSCSLSTSLVRDGKLIGLIACHSFSPIFVDFEQMETILNISQAIEKFLNQEFENNFNHRKEILSSWFKRKDQDLGLIKELFNADSAEVLDENIVLSGRDQILTSKQKYFYSDSFDFDVKALVREDYPGVACVHLNDGRVLVLYREEFAHDKIWGGAPSSKIPYKGGSIEPRKSFESFVEKVKNRSRSWSENEIRSMEYLSLLN